MSWSQIRGHDRQIDAFARAMRAGRLGHAYLFTGPDGVGKKLFATELAKTLLCENPPRDRFEACDRCHGCILVAAGTHPDLIIVGLPPEKHEFPIDVMRDLVQRLSLKPSRGSRRVAIVDDADHFNDESANCFLKTLEEPPPGSLLILVGNDLDAQIATIRSRCQHVSFDALPADQIAKMLQAEGASDADLIARVVNIADGSPGLARAIADEKLWSFRRAFLEAASGTTAETPVLAKQWMTLVEAVGKESALQRKQAGLILRLILDAYRQAALLAMGVEPPTAIDPKEKALFNKLAQRFGTVGLLDRIDRCLDAEAHIDRRVQLILLVEALVDALTQPEGVVNFRPAWAM